MRNAPRLPIAFRPSLSFVLLIAFFAVLWIAGGTSRADMYGQAVTRTGAWLALITVAIFGRAPDLRSHRSVVIILAAAICLAIAQLIPLPPSIWENLPGRHMFIAAAELVNQPQPWRPVAIVPELAENALSSLIVPVTILMLFAGLRDDERKSTVGLLLIVVLLSTLVGLIQLSGGQVNDPLIDARDQVAGTFANRNHFALFLAIGCLLVPVWAFSAERRPGWRAAAGVGLVLLLVLTTLATGSRAGAVLAVIALGFGAVLVRKEIKRSLRGVPAWALLAGGAALVLSIIGVALVSYDANRALSIHRLLTIDPYEDLRKQALPTVLAMVRTYFPVGAGLGSFDPIFRIHEPLTFLNYFFFNRAHNDFLEIAIEAGAPGLLLLAGALGWWLAAGVRAWRSDAGSGSTRSRLGWTILLLVALASIFDYPGRTPLMMATATLAACWLSRNESTARRAATKRERRASSAAAQ